MNSDKNAEGSPRQTKSEQSVSGEATVEAGAKPKTKPGSRSPTDSVSERPPVYRVVLTGGPCAGKTTTAATLANRFRALGWNVYTVAEAASLLLKGGCVNFYSLDEKQTYEFQQSLLRVMISLEDAFYQMALSSGERSIILMDRGFLDASAYMSAEQWSNLLKANNWDETMMRDQRYDLVLHMVTCAEGAPDFYNLPGEHVRSEDLEKARIIDEKIKARWVGHPYLRVFGNQKMTFQRKIDAAISAVNQFVGEPVPMTGLVKRKFLVEQLPPKLPVSTADYAVEHTYLKNGSGNSDEQKRTQMRVRSRTAQGVTTFTLTTRHASIQGQNVQIRRQITKREFETLRMHKDESRYDVKKQRISFLYGPHYYEVDRYLNCQDGLMLLETYAPRDSEIQLPPFVKIAKEVTTDPRYSMFNIAKIPLKHDASGSANMHSLFGSFRLMK